MLEDVKFEITQEKITLELINLLKETQKYLISSARLQYSLLTVVAISHKCKKKLQFRHELMANGTSKIPKNTKRWLPISTLPKCQCAAE